VSCVSTAACTAVGTYVNHRQDQVTLIESWDGTRWSVVPNPNPRPAGTGDDLSGVSCLSATACVAAGGAGTRKGVGKTLIESWDGTRWSVVPSPDPGRYDNSLNDVSCASPAVCTAVGWRDHPDGPYGRFKTLIESWNGIRWSVVPSPSPGPAKGSDQLDGVSCVSTTACTAVGQLQYPNSAQFYKTLIESWNGTRWSVVPSPNPGPAKDGSALSGVSCVSATACIAAGDVALNKTLIESWNGTRWSVIPTPSPGPAGDEDGFAAVSCISATACTAAGSKDWEKTLIESG
jgi:hypothetical protein